MTADYPSIDENNSGNSKNQTEQILLLLIPLILSVTAYLFWAAKTYRWGFPLDDAWIHQTYARNLIKYGEWVYQPGQPSAGSTAPLWTGWLSLGYWLKLPMLTWAWLSGIVCLGILVLVSYQFFKKEISPNPLFRVGFFLFMGMEWHFTWAALSGMETIPYALVIVSVFVLLNVERKNWLLIGLLIGLGVWLRPDALTLLGPLVWSLLWEKCDWKTKQKYLGYALIGTAIPLLPYFLSNFLISKSVFPNTFYAKQAEYAILQQNPLSSRFFGLIKLPLVGAGVLLLPGFLYELWRCVRENDRLIQAAYLWWFGYTLIYTWRLPVVYQHGRYLIPAMPIFFVLGWRGSLAVLGDFTKKSNSFIRVLGKGWWLSVILVSAGFVGLGANAYAQDVAIIESEMVDCAKWVNQNIPETQLIAIHDIGAFGYFDEHQLLDLAGLISPEVIPIIRDEQKIRDYLDYHEVDYLIIFPDWYPKLVEQAKPIYNTEGEFSPKAGGENMTVYQWNNRR